MTYFGATNLYEKFNETQQKFLQDMVLYIYKGYMALSTFENIWL